MLSPQPDSRVSDPQTVAEASRVASVGLLSESVATDAQDNSANLVPGTESHVDNTHAQTDKDPEHPASDTMQVSAGASAPGGANPRLAILGFQKDGVTKIVGIEAPLLSDQQGDAIPQAMQTSLYNQLSQVKSILVSLTTGTEYPWEITEFMSTLDDREGGILDLIREVYTYHSTLTGVTLQPSLELVSELTRDYEQCKISRMHHAHAYDESVYEKPDIEEGAPETDTASAPTLMPPAAPLPAPPPPPAAARDSSTPGSPVFDAAQLGAIIAAVAHGSRSLTAPPTRTYCYPQSGSAAIASAGAWP